MNANKTGAFIAEVRKDRNMTQKELARKLLVSDKTISRWETGKGYPDIEILPNLSQVLGVSINEILLGEYINDDENTIDNNFMVMYNASNKKRYIRNLQLSVASSIIGITNFIIISNKIVYIVNAVLIIFSIALLINNYIKYSTKELGNQIMLVCEIIGLIGFNLFYYFVYFKFNTVGTIDFVFLLCSLIFLFPIAIDFSMAHISK